MKPPPRDIVDTVVIEIDADYCDTCGARAFVYAEMPSGLSVSYCSHHGTKYWKKLNEQAAKVIDFRWRVGLP